MELYHHTATEIVAVIFAGVLTVAIAANETCTFPYDSLVLGRALIVAKPRDETKVEEER
jgi:hypothetical protein